MARRPLVTLLAVIAILLASNLLVSSLLGLGDAEALYYCYSRYLSLSYLDHPPLIGWLITLSVQLGGIHVMAVRLVPMAMSALSVAVTYRMTRDMFEERAAVWSVLLMLATPVFSVGMVAATPDAPLAVLWPLFTWQLHQLLTDSGKGVWHRLGRPLLLGAILGLALLSKYTGIGLAATAIIVFTRRENRVWLKRPGLYLGALLAVASFVPVLLWNRAHGWAGVWHRLVWTQTGAGFSFRNLGALLGGQLLYLGPPVLALFTLAVFASFRRGLRQDKSKMAQGVLLAASLPTLAMTYLLVLWSDVAEPHWPAAGYLPLFPLAAGFIATAGKRVYRLGRGVIGFGLIVFVAMHLLVLTPLLPMVTSEARYEPRYDLANELRGWPEVAQAIRAVNPDRRPVVAAFYTQCSQLTFVLNRPDDPPVRCISPETDDFDIWQGPFRLPREGALFVTDNRFDHRIETLLPEAQSVAHVAVQIDRGGRPVRRFHIVRLRPIAVPLKK